MKALAPGSTIGIVGGGQLGRMLAIAAAQMGYRCHIYAPESDSVAAEVAADFTCAAYDDMDALMAFAKACDVVTYEFENVPVGPLKVIDRRCRSAPACARWKWRRTGSRKRLFAVRLGGRTAAFEIAGDRQEVGGALEKVGTPAILKTIRMGYDGKGQVRVNDPADISEALAASWAAMR